MTRLLSFQSFGLASLSALGLIFALPSCGSDSPGTTGGTSGTGTTGTAGTGNPATGGSASNTAGSGASTAGTGNNTGTSGSSAGGSSPTGTGGSGTGTSGSDSGTSGSTGTAGTGGGTVVDPVLPALVTSAPNAYWKTDGMLTDATADATLTVNDTMLLQTWEGFGGAFNELGWKVLTTPELQATAMKLLFSASEGANLLWGRIPLGASDYAEIRYTVDDPAGTDPNPNGGEAARPAPDTALSKFGLTRDEKYLIPYIKAAQAVKSDLHFWASPWTPPIWMKSGYAKKSGGTGGGDAKKPSYFDGGTVPNTAANFTAYAELYKKFVEGYKAKGINIEIVSPQNEPGYSQNYPSALWPKESYVAWIKTLGAAMQPLNVRVMLGTLSNDGDMQEDGVAHVDVDLANAVLADAGAKAVVSVVGAQWGVLEKKVNTGTRFGTLPIWATEHRCGNYPWETATYNNTQAPNDQAYGVQSWGYIRDAITKGGVTSYAAWNMVLDKLGLGNDLSRDWKQNALLVVDGGQVKPTPAYYVFRHLSQYVKPMAKVVGTSGSGSAEALAFKNPDGSLVAVVYSATANPNYVVAFGSVKKQFSMPAGGWATIKFKP
jgi:glucosylceramidase